MRRITAIYLLLTLMTSQACTAVVTNTNDLPSNERTESINGRPQPTGSHREFPAGKANTTSIKNTKGVIVLSSKYRKDDFVRFYNEDGSLWYEFTYYFDDRDGKSEYENDNFRAFAFHPDYFVLAVKCINEDRSRYEVIVNEETGLRKFVRKDDPVLKFETSEEHLTKVFAVSVDRKNNPLREAPEERARSIESPDDATFHPVEVKNEWLRVRWSSSKKAGGNDKFGWVKWKENDRILLELFYFS